jgi:hypothetical protein
VQGLFGYFQNGSQAAKNAFGGVITRPVDQFTEFAPYLGMEYGQGDAGTSEWWKKKGLFGQADEKSTSGKMGSLIGSAAGMALMGKQVNGSTLGRALAIAILKDQALSILKSFRGDQNAA